MDHSDSYGIRPGGAGHYGVREGVTPEGTLQYYQDAGTQVQPEEHPYATQQAGRPLQAAAQVAGAAASLALVVGVAIWGYGQVMRDVAGVPVVEALDGPMRTAPAQPGGQISDHAGLSVNQIKGGGAAGGLSPEIRLAPAEVPLAVEDVPAPDLPAPDLQPATRPAPVPVPAEGRGAEALPIVEASLTLAPDAGAPDAGVPESDPAADLTAAEDAAAAAIADALTEGLTALDAATAPAAGGVAESLRPMPRPRTARPGVSGEAAGGTAEVASRGALATDATALALTEQSDTDPVPAGTRLVQFGAFDTPEEARAAWEQIAGQFAPLMADKARVLQQSEAGGRPFWRLRASGFADLAAARRFCSALVADRTDCIPVVAR